MSKNGSIMRVLLFFVCTYLVELAKRAGYIGIGVQIAAIIILMALFLFGEKLIKKFKKK